MTRQIVLDTETTGLEPEQGHRIIEIGCVELINRRQTRNNLHLYLNPDREIDAGAIAVHGISNEFLQDKPRFPEVAEEFLAFVRGADLIIHNAPFDVGFLNHELKLAERDERIGAIAQVTDTLVMAREMHPGQRNSLDALCKRYDVENSHRQLHGALLDSEILADVYLLMTGGQKDLGFFADQDDGSDGDSGDVAKNVNARALQGFAANLIVQRANAEELDAHSARLQAIEKTAGEVVWQD